MGRTRFGVAEHLGIEEVTARQRAARDPVERDRWRMIRLPVAGRSPADVAEATGYSARWVRVVVQRYNEQGPEGLADRRHANPGAAPLLDADGRAALETALEQAPPEGGRWTCAKVAAWIADRTGRKTVPAQRGWVYLRRTGHSPQVPRPRHVRAADPAVAQAVFQKS
jgi:transposase